MESKCKAENVCFLFLGLKLVVTAFMLVAVIFNKFVIQKIDFFTATEFIKSREAVQNFILF